MKCNECGGKLPDGDERAICYNCRCKSFLKGMREKLDKSSKGLFGNYGWICPVCGRGNSPYASSCPCILPSYEITCRC